MTDRACVLLTLLGLLIVGQSCGAGAHAAATPDAGPMLVLDDPEIADPVEQAQGAVDALEAGRWLVAGGLLLMAATGLVRSQLGALGGRWGWLRTDRGGVATCLTLASLGYVGACWAAGRPPTLAGALGTLGAAWAASGGKAQVSRLFRPRDLPVPP